MSLVSWFWQFHKSASRSLYPHWTSLPKSQKKNSYASINVTPEWGAPRAYVGHLTSIAFPALGNLTINLGPCLVSQGCSSVCSVAIKALKDGGLMEVSTCFYKSTTFHYSFSILIYGTPYFVGNVWIVDDMDSLFAKKSTRWGIFDQIWPNFGAPRWGFWPKILLKSQMSHICSGFPPRA